MAAASVSPSAAPVPDADELRAAALRTLKSKRKRPEPTNALPQPVRPAVQRRDSAAVALNYDDDSEPAQQGLPTPPPTATVEPPPPAGSVTDEDVDMAEREEGEISDAEEAAEGLPSTSAPKDSLLAVPSPSTNGVLPISLDRPGNAAMPPPALEASLLLPPSSPVLVRSSAAVPTPAERDLRPKLKIPPEELHEIKLHILDILGLGVPPEYFVDCGLDQDTIAYAFHELNLRLPYNINLNGQENVLYPKPIDERVRIPPKPSKPPPLQTSVPATPKASPSTPLTQRFPPPASGLPPKPSAAVLRADATRSSTIAQPARANAPPMATPVILASSSPASTSKPAATVSPSQPATPRPDLQEMESQKKQELKARKAVLDSLKSKKAAGAAAVNRIPLSATAPLSGIATTSQSVDVSSDPVADFLRSIPVEAAPTSTATVPPLAQSPDPMDVDPVQDLHDLRSTPPVQHPRPSISPPGATAQQDPQSSMRGVKRSRPVAADFNDEAGYASSSSLGSSDNGAPPVKRPAHRNNGKKTSTHVAHPPPAIRKYSSFAGLPNLWQSSHVIHVSDSEDDDDGSEPQHPPSGSTARTAGIDPARPSSRQLTVLQKQELEIQQMKARIAAAEQKKKLLKLKPATTSSTPVEPKQEDLTPTLAEGDVAMSEQLPAPLSNISIPGLSPPLDQLPRLLQQAAAALARTPILSPDPTRLPTPGPAYGFAGSEPSRSRSLSQAVPTPTTPAAVPESRPQGAAASSAPETGDSDEDLYGETRGSGPTKNGGSSLGREDDDVAEAQLQQDDADAEGGDQAFQDTARYLPSQALTQADDDVLGGPRDSAVSTVAASEDKQPTGVMEGSFVAYESVLRRYPSLDSLVDGEGVTSASGSRSSSRLQVRMAANPHGKICQYEVPGGGVCRDATCTDLHLRFLE